jgi:hypothetical protein
MSSRYVPHISSVVLGVYLGHVLRDNGVCPRGYVALHVVILWLRVGIQYVYPCVYSTRAAEYADVNLGVVHIGRPRTAHCVLLSVLGGGCDALSLTMGAANGDSHVLSVAALALSSRTTRVPTLCLVVYVFTSRPLPLVHGVLRGLVTAVSVLSSLAILPRPWAVLKLGVASAVAIAVARPCLSQLGAVSPALLISISLYSLRVNPVLLLTFAIFVNL